MQTLPFTLPGGELPYMGYMYLGTVCAAPKGLVFQLFWSSIPFFFLEEATSSLCPPSPIHAWPSFTPFNACHLG